MAHGPLIIVQASLVPAVSAAGFALSPSSANVPGPLSGWPEISCALVLEGDPGLGWGCWVSTSLEACTGLGSVCSREQRSGEQKSLPVSELRPLF